MKKLITTLAGLALGIAAAAAQDITVHAHDAAADRVFADIMKQSGKNFVYSAGLLDGMKVSVDADNVPLHRVLDMLFGKSAIEYSIRGNNIVLKARKAQAHNITVSGFVREADTDEALVGAVVSAGKVATTTNAMGFYSLTVPAGAVSLTVSYPGFVSHTTAATILTASRKMDITLSPDAEMLDELVVHGSRNRYLSMESTAVGNLNLSNAVIKATPVLFGESDVTKTLQLEPGVSAGVEGMAGMYVHGGNSDENLYMLDNIPLYQVNHLGGLFSAFNTEALRNVDFYKSSFPARYDGRLSSYVDVNTKDGSMESHHGSAKLGLTSGAFDINGPIWRDHTSYSFAIRRSWYDVLTVPVLAIVNSRLKDEKHTFGYAFMDINAKINHRFNDRSNVYAMFYYGDDYLKVGEEFDTNIPNGYYDKDKTSLRWGNIVGSLGWRYVLSPKVFGELTAAYTRYSSKLKRETEDGILSESKVVSYSNDVLRSDNHIDDWIVRADFDYRPHPAHKVNFGASFTHHTFLPSRTTRTLTTETLTATADDNAHSYKANEAGAYIGDDWTVSDALRANAGIHASLFNIDGKTHKALSPRVSLRWTPAKSWAVKASYSRTVQYVHQLIQSSISLPTDQWVPVTAGQRPQTADKISAGAYFNLDDRYTFSVEGYWKWMHNLLEYADEYYLMPPSLAWDAKMVAGHGTSKGIDFKVAKEFGRVSGHVSYSLLWADRQYAGKNGGKPFPARFDNRHKINVLLNWKINDRWEMSASWTGMSGNRITLATQCWEDPSLAPWNYNMLLYTDVNNYRLPFYHRMDLAFKRNTKHGYWTFSAYNAYCNMNVIAVDREYADTNYDSWSGHYEVRPIFRKIKLLPIIPSVSYTWTF